MTKKLTATQLAALADKAFDLKQQRLAHDKEGKLLKSKEDALLEQLQAELERAGVNGITGDRGRANLEEVTKATVTDWPALRAYIQRYDAWDLLQNRLSESAVLERAAAGKTVSGVELSKINKLAFGKA